MKRIGILLSLLMLTVWGVCAQNIKDFETVAAEQMSQGNFTEALSSFQQAIDLVDDSTSNAVIYAYAGVCANELGETAIAKTYFIESINRGIEEPQVFDALAEISKREKDYDMQIYAYNAGVERSPADKQKYLLKLCSVYKKKKNADELMRCASAVLSEDKQNLKALEYKGTALQYQKKMTEAEGVFQVLYDLDSENINANIFLGNYNYQVGKSKLASSRKKYEKIENPTRVQWHEHNEDSKALMAEYYSPAIKYLEYVNSKKSNKSIKNMLFVMYTKMGEKEKAATYQE